MLFLALFIALILLLMRSRRRGFAQPMMFLPTDNDDQIRRASWLSTSGSDSGGSSDSGGPSSSDGGSFGDGGGFSGGGSSDTI
jgi:uncharacterized membrane protein YgcG